MRYQIPTKAVLFLLFAIPISGLPALSFFVFGMLVLVLLDLRGLRILTRELLYPSGRSVGECAKEVLGILNPKGRKLHARHVGMILLAVLLAVIMAMLLFANGIHLPHPIRSFVYRRTRNYLIFLVIVAAIFLIDFYHMMLLQMKPHSRGGVSYGQMLRHFLPIYLEYFIVYALIFAVAVVIPTLIIGRWNFGSEAMRFLNILIFVIGFVVVSIASLLILPLLYLEWNGVVHHLEVVAGHPSIADWANRPHKKFWWDARKQIVALVLLIFIITGLLYQFAALFPEKSEAMVISHRGGGVMAGENTLEGLEAAIELGAGGCEIDIQRTADGHYVVNHDRTFARVAGSNLTAQDMTLEQIKKLHIRGRDGAMYQVATLDEMLQAAKGRIHLFIELKGISANKKMVREVVRMIEDYDMEDECSLISMNYNLVQYAETTYPTVDTGYVCYFSYGHVVALDCDFLVLQDKGATASTLIMSQLANKRTYIWTINKPRRMSYFLNGIANGIITDRPKKAVDLYQELNQ
ncbi:MAG: hypothetical protein K6A05_03055 [Lachnospiraceae bacterium]|nr:hypothetical protein [Lachnospiraceae bacterium]